MNQELEGIVEGRVRLDWLAVGCSDVEWTAYNCIKESTQERLDNCKEVCGVQGGGKGQVRRGDGDRNGDVGAAWWNCLTVNNRGEQDSCYKDRESGELHVVQLCGLFVEVQLKSLRPWPKEL
jgi:hypothetical protein